MIDKVNCELRFSATLKKCDSDVEHSLLDNDYDTGVGNCKLHYKQVHVLSGMGVISHRYHILLITLQETGAPVL